MTDYGSVNWITRCYFDCLRRLVRQAEAADPGDPQRQAVVLSIFMATAVVETFLNIWFRTFSESGGPVEAHRATILRDINTRRGLAHKFKTWPGLCFGRSFGGSLGSRHEFLILVERRNQLTHFTTNYESVEFPGIRIDGLVDLSPYSTLDAEDALRLSA